MGQAGRQGHRTASEQGHALRIVLHLVAVVLFLAVAGVVSDSEPDDPTDLATIAALCAVCWSAPPPALQQLARACGLTHREVQVARCAAAGSTNRDIAQHLGLNVRTVEGHLLRAYEKLGIHTRVRLALLIQNLMEPH